jgi:hypothetical protein
MASLLALDLCRLDHLRPALDLVGQQLTQLVGRTPLGADPEGLQLAMPAGPNGTIRVIGRLG